MSERQSVKFLLPLVLVFGSLGVTPASAALPVNLGSFELEITTDTQSAETEPTQSCLINSVYTDNDDAIAKAMFTLQGDQTLLCKSRMIATANASVDRAIVTNESLGLTGTAVIVCDFKQVMDMDYSFGYKDVDAQPTLYLRYNEFNVSGVQSCSWVMNFNDSKKSSLVGEMTSPLMSGSSVDSGTNLINVTINLAGEAGITGGTGMFAGVRGSTIFDQTGTMSLPAEISFGDSPMSVRSAPSAFAEEGEPPLVFKRMKLVSKKGGAIRFVSPPLTNLSKRNFGVVAGTASKLRLVTAPGAKCTISATMGSKTVKLTSQPLVTKNGVLNTSITAALVAQKFGYKKPASYLNKKARLTATCNAGLNKKNISEHLDFSFANI